MRGIVEDHCGGGNKKLIELAAGYWSGEPITEIAEENFDIWRLLNTIKDPWRREAMTGGVIGLDINLLRGIARDLGIKRTERLYQRLSIFESEIMKFIRGKEDVCDDKQKELCKYEFGNFAEWACKNCEKGKVNAK